MIEKLKNIWNNWSTKKKLIVCLVAASFIWTMATKKETVNTPAINQKPVSVMTPPAIVEPKSNFVTGKLYKFYRDGSCKSEGDSVCISKSEAEQLCSQIKGYTSQMLTYVYQMSGRKSETLFTAGKVGPLRAKWNGSECDASISASGMFEGSSAKVTYSGYIATFVVDKDGDVLAHWLSGMMD